MVCCDIIKYTIKYLARENEEGRRRVFSHLAIILMTTKRRVVKRGWKLSKHRGKDGLGRNDSPHFPCPPHLPDP